MNTNAVVIAASEETTTVMEKLQIVGIEYGVKIVGALIFLIIGMWIAKLIKRGIVKLMEKRNVDPTLISFAASLLYVALQIFVIVAALEKLDVKTTSFVAILGAAGLAVGLAMQGSLSNFASGVLMIIFKPFKVGDFVEAGGIKGGVQEISIFTTILNTPDNKKIIVPNSKVMGDNITNFNANGTRRVDLVIGVSYGDDIGKAKEIMMDVLKSHELVLQTPEPAVAVLELADSSVNYVVRPWCKSSDYWTVRFDVTESVKLALEANGLTIPFPQRDVHMINAPTS